MSIMCVYLLSAWTRVLSQRRCSVTLAPRSASASLPDPHLHGSLCFWKCLTLKYGLMFCLGYPHTAWLNFLLLVLTWGGTQSSGTSSLLTGLALGGQQTAPLWERRLPSPTPWGHHGQLCAVCTCPGHCTTGMHEDPWRPGRELSGSV